MDAFWDGIFYTSVILMSLGGLMLIIHGVMWLLVKFWWSGKLNGMIGRRLP